MLAIITPVSLADQRLDSFTATQVQLMIISCSVSLHPIMAVVGRQQPITALGALRRALHSLAQRWPILPSGRRGGAH